MAPVLVAIGTLFGLKVVGAYSLITKNTLSSFFLMVYIIITICSSVWHYIDNGAIRMDYLDICYRYWKYFILLLQTNLGLTDQAMVGIPMAWMAIND